MNGQFKYGIACMSNLQELVQFNMKLVQQTEPDPLQRSLVHQGIKYILEHPQYGRFYIAINDHHLIGQMLLTQLSPATYMIQSVYVHQQYRQQGVFRRLFHQARHHASHKGVKQIRLYAIKTNEKAINTYKTMGFQMTGQEFYTIDFVYDSHLSIQSIKKSMAQGYTIIGDSTNYELSEMQTIFDNGSQQCTILYCLKDNKICGSCQFVRQYSIWRNKITIYIMALCISVGQNGQDITYAFRKYLYDGMNLGVIRYICPQQRLQLLQKCETGMRRDHHCNLLMKI